MLRPTHGSIRRRQTQRKSKTMTPHYLYTLVDLKGQIRYVGLTSDPARREWRHANRPDTAATQAASEPLIFMLMAVLQDKEEGHRVERLYFKACQLRNDPLLNRSREWPADDPRRGRPKAFSPTRSESLRVSWAARSAKDRTRAGERMAAGRVQQGPMSEETKKKISEAARARWTPEARAAHSQTMTLAMAKRRKG